MVAVFQAVEAVGAGKIGVLTAKLGGPGVHLVKKGLHVPIAQVISDGAGRVVAAGQKAGVEQAFQRHRLAYFQVRVRAVLRLDTVELRPQVLGDGEGLGEVLAALRQQQAGHHFGEAGGSPHLVGVFFVHHRVGVHIVEHHRLGVHRAFRRLPPGGGGKGPGERRREGQRQGQAFFHHVPFPPVFQLLSLYGNDGRLTTNKNPAAC